MSYANVGNFSQQSPNSWLLHFVIYGKRKSQFYMISKNSMYLGHFSNNGTYKWVFKMVDTTDYQSNLQTSYNEYNQSRD